MSIGFWQIAIVVILVVLLFGRGKISGLMGDVAKGIKSFKKGMSSETDETLKNISSNYEWILLANSDILLPIHNFDNMKLTIEKYRKDNDYYALFGNKEKLFDGFIEYKNKCIPTLLNFYKTNSYIENINNKISNLEKFKHSSIISTYNLKNLDNKVFLENKNCFGVYWKYINLENINNSEINYLSRFICQV
mgnify:CR=1 FL=1